MPGLFLSVTAGEHVSPPDVDYESLFSSDGSAESEAVKVVAGSSVDPQPAEVSSAPADVEAASHVSLLQARASPVQKRSAVHEGQKPASIRAISTLCRGRCPPTSGVCNSEVGQPAPSSGSELHGVRSRGQGCHPVLLRSVTGSPVSAFRFRGPLLH